MLLVFCLLYALVVYAVLVVTLWVTIRDSRRRNSKDQKY